MSTKPDGNTQYGFRFHPLEVTRIASSDKWGCAIDVETPLQRIEIRATPTGILRVGPIIKKAKKKGQ